MFERISYLWNMKPFPVKYACLAVLFLIGMSSLSAQELNALVRVDHSRVRGANREIFIALEEELRAFVNGRKWTDNLLDADERVSCSFMLVINEVPSSGSFLGELYVQSYRPVKNSDYSTPLLNIRDKEVEFDYDGHSSLQFDPNFIQENLTATVAYYAYLVLGLHLDSQSLRAGTPCFRDMDRIAANCRSFGWKGWEHPDKRNRSSIAFALTDASLDEFRQMWFDYHVQGLDMAESNSDLVLVRIIDSIRILSSLQAKHFSYTVSKLFGDAKLEEMINFLSKTEEPQKQQGLETLSKLYPARSRELERLR